MLTLRSNSKYPALWKDKVKSGGGEEEPHKILFNVFITPNLTQQLAEKKIEFVPIVQIFLRYEFPQGNS